MNKIIIETKSRKNPIRVMIPIHNIYNIEEVKAPEDGDFNLAENSFDITFRTSNNGGIEIMDQFSRDNCEYLNEDKTFVRIYKPNRNRDSAEFLIFDKKACSWKERGREIFVEGGLREIYLPNPNESDAPFVKLVEDIVFEKWREETMDTYIAAIITLTNGAQINSLTAFDNLLYKIETADQ